jgi:hypothetical protein
MVRCGLGELYSYVMVPARAAHVPAGNKSDILDFHTG